MFTIWFNSEGGGLFVDLVRDVKGIFNPFTPTIQEKKMQIKILKVAFLNILIIKQKICWMK